MAKFTKGNKGKPPGSVNKTTKSAREAFQLAFDKLGGFDAMVKWANSDPENLKVFYGLYARLIPQDVTTNGKELGFGPVTIIREIMPARHE